MYGIHWFRRDLRVAGNRALQNQFKEFKGRVLGLFCFDKKFLARNDFSINRFQFFLNTLETLKKELIALGSDLLVLDVGPQEAFTDLFNQMKEHRRELPHSVSWNRDYEPFARQRDEKIRKTLEGYQVQYDHYRDHLLIEPHELEKEPQEGYQVYSPFARKWNSIFEQEQTQARVNSQKAAFKHFKSLKNNKLEKIFDLQWKQVLGSKISYPDHLKTYSIENSKSVTVPIPPAGSLAAFKTLEEFKKKLDEYGKDRDQPDLNGTSKLSMYLKNGSITVPQIIYFLNLQPYKKKSTGRDVFLSELIWREFYYHILYRNPQVERKAFLEKYRNIQWENNKKWFTAWKEGKTGFPIVDAGMRELKTTGWMHNRVRMIVASFLCKDLLINWQWGEKYFMETLLDGDLAPNNGGWQWAASTGCDPQPYFRIFNPWLQSKKFDPQGNYIKRFIPELEDIEAKHLHQPIIGHSGYPEPIVDHKEQREKALKMYKAES